MTSGYMSLRELEDNCKVNIRFMYLMENDQLLPAYNVQVSVADEYKVVVNVNQYHSDMDCMFVYGVGDCINKGQEMPPGSLKFL